MTPQRIQRKRTKGWRKPPNSVIVTRPGKYGNPFHTLATGMPVNKEFCATIHRLWINGELEPELAALFLGDTPMPAPPTHDEIRRDLAGKNLACYCNEDQYCHGDNLLPIANEVPA